MRSAKPWIWTNQRVHATALLATGLTALSTMVVGCGGDYAIDEASKDVYLLSSFVVMASDSTATARIVTTNSQCPLIVADGNASRMQLRAAAATLPQRTTASAPADSKPSEFPVTTCELRLPTGATTVTVGSRRLPVAKPSPTRIVILADTGCRMKKADNAFQACSDPAAFPLGTIADVAAALKPDLVMHIGDYHYRENACPADVGGCNDSPWGYGWDTWNADLFTPAAPLLAAAPWIVVRGNHEECTRAGQGWFRMLDTQAYATNRTCDVSSNDELANYSMPYAVSLGADTQMIVFDSARAGKVALSTTDSQFTQYQSQFRVVEQLAAKAGIVSMFANHHPILGYTPVKGAIPLGGNVALQSVMQSLNATAYYPPGIQAAFHGHVHDFQAINFSSSHPATFVSGNGGDNIDPALPDPFPTAVSPAPGVALDAVTHSTTFGFMLMERIGTAWSFKAYSRSGAVMATCAFANAKVKCDKTGFLAP
ncbi:MAG: metallophosphoesterase [Burkholderiaceae bacterium]